MARLVLFLVLSVFVARAFWKLVDSFLEGVTGQSRTRTPQRTAAMVRDPICGTFILPDRALTLGDGQARVFFCSDACRDRYRSQSSTRTA